MHTHTWISYSPPPLPARHTCKINLAHKMKLVWPSPHTQEGGQNTQTPPVSVRGCLLSLHWTENSTETAHILIRVAETSLDTFHS